jgi:ligand-binding sensor domain-containing protein
MCTRIVIAFVCCLTHQLFGQQLSYFPITQQNGLPSNTVYDIFQDSDGFLWVATENGLARYNGFSFTTFTSSEIRSLAVGNLTEDSYKRIWLHNFFGEILFVENDSLQKLTSWEKYYTDGFPSISSTTNQLLINSNQHLYSFRIPDKKWTMLNPSGLPPSVSVNYNHHAIDHSGLPWICYSTNEETIVEPLQPKGNERYIISHKQYIVNRNVSRIFFWKKSVWFFDPISRLLLELTEGRVINRTKVFEQVLDGSRHVKNLGDSLLFFYGVNGAYAVDSLQSVIPIIRDKNVSCVTADREGGLWVGTLNEGILYYPLLNSFYFDKNSRGLYTKLAYDPSSNRIFAGSYDGLIDVFSSEGQILHRIQTKNRKEVQCLFIDSLTHKLFTYTNAVQSYDLTTYREAPTLELPATKDIIRIGNHLVMATSAGLHAIDLKTRNKKKYFDQQRISAVAYDSCSKTIWVGSQKGLFTVNLHDLQPTLWQPGPALKSPGVSCILPFHYGLVVGTITNGLFIVMDGKMSKHITTRHGLPSDRITSICSRDSILWIGSDKGIAVYNLQSESTYQLNETKGLLAQEIYDVIVTQHNLWVSHAKGLQIFNISEFLNVQKPRVHIKSLSSNGKKMKHGTILRLSPDSRQLTAVFDISNNLRAQGTTQILYRIKEIDKHWNATTLKNPIANYLALPFGKLTLEVKAKNENGVDSANTLYLPIEVLAPLWKQSWFLITVMIMITCGSLLLFYYRIKKIKAVNQLRIQQLNLTQELRIAQLTSIRAQMNPHFIFNTMALIQGKVLNGLRDEANQYIHVFSSLLRNVLDFSSREMIPLQEEIEILEKYLLIEKDRFAGSLEYTISQDQQTRNELIQIPTLLTQPFVENALRHGLMHREGPKKLLIDFSVKKDTLIICIDDNGIGRQASSEFNRQRKKEHNSFAIKAYQKRIDLLNATRSKKINLIIEDKHSPHGLPTGTRVTIKIPLEHATN